MAKTLDDLEGGDIIYVEDITDRFEALESDLQAEHEESGNVSDFATWIDYREADDDDAAEYKALDSILSEMRGYGGNHKWRGDWYPDVLLRDSYFESYIDEMLEDIGDLPKDIPSYLTITVDYEALQQDYTSIEVRDDTYWYK